MSVPAARPGKSSMANIMTFATSISKWKQRRGDRAKSGFATLVYIDLLNWTTDRLANTNLLRPTQQSMRINKLSVLRTTKKNAICGTETVRRYR